MTQRCVSEGLGSSAMQQTSIDDNEEGYTCKYQVK